MRASYNWLRELSGVDAPPQEVADRLTAAGLEVEGIESHGDDLAGVVVAEVRGTRAHPKRDKLSLVTVDDGEAEHEVVCGAPNVPSAGGRVLFARVGTSLPNGMQIEERKIGGELSRGMICSEIELDIGSDGDGIIVLGDEEVDVQVGAPAADSLGLRDTIFEIGLTPNRPDCLGHIGLARELAALYGRSFETPPIPSPQRIAHADDTLFSERPERMALDGYWAEAETTEAEAPESESAIDVEIADPDRCPRYGAAAVLGVRVGRSPLWLRHRLHRLGMRAVSNVVDATNYLLLEQGHPIHAFDLARVRDRRIVVRRARTGERMTTIDHVERTFDVDDLLICDGQGPVAVAGVMGGLDTEIGAESRDVLIECAYFEPRSVRRTSRRHGMHTEASHRFERGVDPGAVPRVLARAAALLHQLCGGTAAAHALDVCPGSVEPARIALRLSRASKLLGTEVTAADARYLLERLGCEWEPGVQTLAYGEEEVLEVRAPTWRPDLVREVDLVEEIGRLRGYDDIPSEVPRIQPSSAGSPRHIGVVRRARELSASAGLYEVVNYAFVSRAELETCRAPTSAVPLANPLSEERSVMRTSLLPGLAANARHAQRRQVTRVRLFELGRTFHRPSAAGQTLPDEIERWALLLLGARMPWIGDDGAFDFYDAKGMVESVVEPLVGQRPETVLDDGLEHSHPFLHPRRRASVVLQGVTLGALGEVHPDVTDQLELSGRPVYAELQLARVLDAADHAGVPQARVLPRYPAVTRDIAMIVRDEHAAGTIADALHASAEGLVEDVTLFDLYRGKPVQHGYKSLAFRVVYRDPNGTLTDERVDELHARLGRTVEQEFGAALR